MEHPNDHVCMEKSYAIARLSPDTAPAKGRFCFFGGSAPGQRDRSVRSKLGINSLTTFSRDRHFNKTQRACD